MSWSDAAAAISYTPVEFIVPRAAVSSGFGFDLRFFDPNWRIGLVSIPSSLRL